MFGYGYVASLAQLCHPAAVSCYEVGLFHITKLRLFYSGEQASTGSNSRPAPVRSGLRGRGQVSEAIQRLMSWSHQASELYTGAPFGGRLQQQLKLDDFPFLGPGGVKGLPPQTSQAPAARRERQQFAVSRAHWFKDLQASADIGSALGGIHPAGTLPCPDHLPSASTGLDKTASVMSWLSKQPHVARAGLGATELMEASQSTRIHGPWQTPWTRHPESRAPRAPCGRESESGQVFRCWSNPLMRRVRSERAPTASTTKKADRSCYGNDRHPWRALAPCTIDPLMHVRH